MSEVKRDLSKIIHISKEVHSKLKKFVTDKQIDGCSTSLSRETEIAVLKHIKTKS